ASDGNRMAPGARADYVVMVPARILDDILQEAEAPVPIDLLSIDVEGHELEVLRGFDLHRWKPRLMMIEDHVADLSKHYMLIANGYRLIRRVGNNGWYVPPDTAVDMRLRDRCETVRTYSLALPSRM